MAAAITAMGMMTASQALATADDAATAADRETSAAVAAIAYPETRRTDVADVQFGVAVPDPYRWLENDVRVDAEVAQWVAAQNAVTDSYLSSLPGRNALAARMAELYRYDRFGLPERRANRYFYTRNNGQQNQSVLYVRDGLAGEGRVLIDPNTWAADGATALAEWVPSDDGTRLLYTVQDGGTDWRIVRVMDVATGAPVGEELRWVKFSNLAWAPDGSGFWYSRFPAPEEGATFQSTNLNQAVYFHRIGTPQSEDRLVYATPDHPSWGHSAEITDDGRYLVITSSEGTDDRHEIHLVNLARPDAAPIPLMRGLDHKWELVGNDGDRLFFLTDQNAARGRIVALHADARQRIAPREIVAEREATLEGAHRVGNRLILSYLGNASSQAEMVDLNGRRVSQLTLGTIGTAGGFEGSARHAETFYSFSSFNRPTTIYRLDTETGRSEVFAAPQVTFNPDDYSVEQRFYTSRDGTRVPMFIVMKRGIDRTGGSPTLLYGYGGFAVPVTPGFSPTRLAWLDAGGVYVVANIRGGSEFGGEWHDAGRLLNKQNVFDDFIAAGEYLIAEGITGRGELAIEGRSNGGLLVGAVVNQRPDLFAAALPGVGVMDMLRFDRFTAGRYWVDDYGRPDQEPDFRNLFSYSPYHNIRTGQDYPAILVTTADTDDRVVPGHSFKYTAALQAADIGDRPHLIRIETRAGHGSGKPVDKIVDEFADMYAFVARWTGLDIEAGLGTQTAAAPAVGQ
ncbi:MAG: prolyl oligopeptidase family serine peptidase [Sphingopyxis sp.]|nr:prolyl oligopeptidase family serine peptidase [Sphingopyxis sp.]